MNRQETKKRERERTPNNRTTTEFRISDELWAVFQPLLPVHVNTHCFGGGCLRVSHRDRAYAIFYVPLERDASAQAGTFLKLWQAGIEQFKELCGIDLDWLSKDGAMRHPPPWAGNKPIPLRQTEATAGRNAACSTYGHGVPIGLTTLGANRRDRKLARPTSRAHHR